MNRTAAPPDCNHCLEGPATWPGGKPPTSLVLAGTVARALGLTCDHHVPATLKKETTRRGFRGERRTRRWCCSVSAIGRAMLDQAVLVPPDDLHDRVFRILLTIGLSGEAVWWDCLDAEHAASPLAHFRYGVISATQRIGMILGSAQPPTMLDPDPAWLDPARRGELIEEIRRSGGATKAALADQIHCDPKMITRWTHQRRTPGPMTLRVVAAWAARHAHMDEAETHRALRWHYGLATLTDEASALLGRSAVAEACRLALEMLHCTRRSTALLPPEKSRSRHAALPLNFHDFEEVETSLIVHARNHGADEAFLRDLRSAHAALRAAAEPSAPSKSFTLGLFRRMVPHASVAKKRNGSDG